jgi:hypothetical protein
MGKALEKKKSLFVYTNTQLEDEILGGGVNLIKVHYIYVYTDIYLHIIIQFMLIKDMRKMKYLNICHLL